MPRRKALEDTLEELARVRDDPRAPEALKLLGRALGGRSSHSAAKAAQIAGEGDVQELVDAMVGAFDRFLDKPIKSDPGCAAKEAIADAADL